jgi:hypothetical protein
MTLISLCRQALPVLGGVVVGAAVVVLVETHGKAVVAPPTVVDDLVRASAAPATSENALLERRVAELEDRVRLSQMQAPQRAVGTPPAPRSEALLAEREAATQREIDEHKKLVAQHAAEPRDTSWAASEESDVHAKLLALSSAMNQAFVLRSVDCRTASCVAELEWANQDVAKAHLRSLLSGSSDVQCARQIAFPTSEGSGAYTASFYLDCTEARWAGGATRPE